MEELIKYLKGYSNKKKIAIWPAGLNTKSLLKAAKDMILKENITIFDSILLRKYNLKLFCNRTDATKQSSK